jgi:hypothetical protein
MRGTLLALLATAAVGLIRAPAARGEPISPAPGLAEKYLMSGQLAEGEVALQALLKEHPTDDHARFGLGTIQFLRGVERLAQALHRHGLRSESRFLGNLPIVRLPVPPNPMPQPVSYDGWRRILQTLIDDLRKAEATLAPLKDVGVKLPLRFGLIRLDLNGDGRAGEDEILWKLYARLNQGAALSADTAKAFIISFDRGDVAWLRGYCHLLMALGEFVLAHDGKELFECTAHLFFEKVDSPHPFLVKVRERGFHFGGDYDIRDLIAFLHLIRLPVQEPRRLTAALEHVQAMLARSRESWKLILAETDDDYEWIPNPRQKGVIPNVRVNQEMVDSWLEFLTEAEALLAGQRLAPFWRGDDGRGINLRRVFTEPRTFDLVLWVQGTAATPYLEEGTLTRPGVWQRLQRVFGGEFIGFALWFN